MFQLPVAETENNKQQEAETFIANQHHTPTFSDSLWYCSIHGKCQGTTCRKHFQEHVTVVPQAIEASDNHQRLVWLLLSEPMYEEVIKIFNV